MSITFRERLLNAFSDEELRSFAFDHFPDLSREYTTGITRSQMVRLLLEYVRGAGRIPELLDHLERVRPGLVNNREEVIRQLDQPQPGEATPSPTGSSRGNTVTVTSTTTVHEQSGGQITGVEIGALNANEATIRNVNTGGGDYAERDIDKRQGAFIKGSTVTNSTIIGQQNIYNLPSVAPALRPGSAPPLPGLIIGREGDLHALKVRLGISGSTASVPLQVLTTVRGWPGVGKTTLAAALAHDTEIAEAFPDRVLWASLGQDPKILSELAAWGRALGIDDLIRGTVGEASARLTALLRDKRALLIVDDVWEAAHAVPFKVGGRGCAQLITTRLTSVADALASTHDAIYKLAVLTDDKALELLQALAPDVVREHPGACHELVRELEGLPLALQVAGHLLRAEIFDVPVLLDELREGSKLLRATAPPDRSDLVNETTPTVAVLLQKSTDQLDPFTRDCFAFLGAFAPKPATFDLAAMQYVWQVEQDGAKSAARTLVNRGLVEPIGNGRFWMHALLVTHAKSFLTDE